MDDDVLWNSTDKQDKQLILEYLLDAVIVVLPLVTVFSHWTNALHAQPNSTDYLPWHASLSVFLYCNHSQLLQIRDALAR
jgi:hypothetical protein